MKKNVLFLAAGLLTFASCSQDETTGLDNGGAIKFRPNVSNVTRGPIYTPTSYFNSFNVTSFIEGAASNFFENLQVNKSGADWNTAQDYYWPGTGTLKFFAYAPADVANVVVNPTSQKINNFTPESSVAAQKDLVVASNTGTKAGNETSGVAMNFKHALSQINVQAKSANTTSYEIKVLGVKLCNIASTASFTFPASTVASGLVGEGQWSTPATLKKYGSKLASEVTLGASEANITKDNFLMIPQKLTAWDKTSGGTGAYISVLCQISSKNGSNTTQIFPPAAGKFAYASVPVDTKWLPGKKYTYKLNFLGGGGAGNIDPDPSNPDTPDDPQVDPTPGPGGNPVLGGVIKFTVTVEDWDGTTPAGELNL